MGDDLRALTAATIYALLVLVGTALPAASTPRAASVGTWVDVGPMSQPRELASAVPLKGGKVLIAGASTRTAPRSTTRPPARSP